MARSKTGKEKMAVVAAKDNAIVEKDAYAVANEDIDSIYQSIRSGEPGASQQLRDAAVYFRLKMSLASHKQKLAIGKP